MKRGKTGILVEMSCIEEEKGELSEGEGEIYILLTVAHRVDIGAHELFVFTCWQTEEVALKW